MSDPVLRRRGDDQASLTLTFDGHTKVPAREGETVSTALLCAGIVATSRSLKFRRPRGPFCLRGDCGTCLVRIDGRPNIRACLTPVRDGMRIDPQNRVTVGRGPDPTGIADKVFGEQMDHHHFMVRPRVLNEIMKGIARNLAGLGMLPDRVDERPTEHRHHSCDVVVVGAGPAGRAAATMIRSAGRSCVVFDRLPASVLPPSSEQDDFSETGVFGIYADEGVVAATTLRLRGTDVIHTSTPRHVLFATGSRDAMIPLENNDIPGVMSARGLAAVVRESGVEALSCVVVGDVEDAAALAKRLDAPLVAPADVVEIEGGRSVEGIALASKTIPCSTVALAPAPSAVSELARLGGARVQWDGAGFPLVRDDDGRIDGVGPWTAWACGGAAGVFGRAPAEEDARAVARAILGSMQ